MSNAINMTAILLISALAFSQPASVPVITDASAVAIAQNALAERVTVHGDAVPAWARLPASSRAN